MKINPYIKIHIQYIFLILKTAMRMLPIRSCYQCFHVVAWNCSKFLDISVAKFVGANHGSNDSALVYVISSQ